MAKFVAVDFGERWCGLAVSQGDIAEPWGAVEKKMLADEVKRLEPEVLIFGISEGRMAEKTRQFANHLAGMLRLEVEFSDETLSSREVEALGKKDKKKQHAMAAAVILERYLEQIANRS